MEENNIKKHRDFLTDEKISMIDRIDYILDNYPYNMSKIPTEQSQEEQWWITARGMFVRSLYSTSISNRFYIPLKGTPSDCEFGLDKNHLSIVSPFKFKDVNSYIGKTFNSSDVSMMNFWRVKIEKIEYVLRFIEKLKTPKYLLKITVSKEHLGSNWKDVPNLNTVDFIKQDVFNPPVLRGGCDKIAILKWWKEYYSKEPVSLLE